MIEATEEHLRVYKAAYDDAYEGVSFRGKDWRLAGIEAVLNMPKLSTPGVAFSEIRVEEIGSPYENRWFRVYSPNGEVMFYQVSQESLERDGYTVPEPLPEPDPLEGYDEVRSKGGFKWWRNADGKWDSNGFGSNLSSQLVIDRYGPVRPVILGDPIGGK